MKITPVKLNYFNSFKTNFSGKKCSESPKASDENNFSSKQNNSDEVFIPTDVYLGITSKMVSNQIKKDISANDDELNEMTDVLFGSEEEILSSMETARFTAQTMLYALRAGAEVLMQETPGELTGKIPRFINIGADDFFVKMDKSVQRKMKTIENLNGKEYADYTNEEKAKIVDDTIGLANVLKHAARILKTENYDEVKEIFDKLSDGMNYDIYKAVQAGLNGDAADVINIMTYGVPSWMKPEIQNNNDGTLTYRYNDSSLVDLSVVRNARNGDYISAVMKEGESVPVVIDFREDGAIKELRLKNEQFDYEISISANDANDGIIFHQYYPNRIVEKKYSKEKDGTLEQTSMCTYYIQK